MRTIIFAMILLAGLNAYAAEKPEEAQPDAGSATVKNPKMKPDGVTQGDLDNLEQKEAGGKEKQPNPLDMIAGEMIKAQVKLKQGKSGPDTQESQARAIKMLDKLIELAEQQQQNQQNQQNQQQQQERQQNQQQNAQNSQPQNSQSQSQSQQQQSTQAAQESREGGAGGKAAVDDNNDGAKGIEWGNLPPKAREEYDQILKEDFPEVYKRLLELYYRNLSE